jgi:hypothetical protein
MGEPKISENTTESNAEKILDIDELRSEVLNAVADDDFDRAIETLYHFLNQPSDYPQFRNRLVRLVGHAVDLVNAIRAKKSFPGLSNLTRSKQQEIADRIRDHFNELQGAINKMDRVIDQLRREDVRSTIWIIRAIIYASGVIVIVAFLKEVTGGLWGVFETVTSNSLDKGIDWVVGLLK